MVTLLAIEGVERRTSFEAAIRRWIARIDRACPLTSCRMSVLLEPQLLGKPRVRIDLAVRSADAEVTIMNALRVREPTVLYALIGDAFRDAYQRIAERPTA